MTGHRLHNETVKALLGRYFFWRHEEFRIAWSIPAAPEGMRQEIVKLRQAGWSDRTIAGLMIEIGEKGEPASVRIYSLCCSNSFTFK
jgi:hypothetical protein